MYCQLHEHYFENPKTRALQRELGDLADVYPVRLWGFCLRYAKSGVLKSSEYVEMACGWTGEKGKLLAALKKYGFIEADGCTVHDWLQHTGKGIRQCEHRQIAAQQHREMSKAQRKAAYERMVGALPDGYREALQGEPTVIIPDQEPTPQPPQNGDLMPGTPEHRLFKLAMKVVQGVPTTVRSYLEKWIAQKGLAEVEKILMDPNCKGQSVLSIQKYFFDTLGAKQTGGFLG
jgi:hypothetical protein